MVARPGRAQDCIKAFTSTNVSCASSLLGFVASISEIRPGILAVDEDRMLRSDTDGFPDQIVTRGLATLALIFHPLMRDDYDMTCEGLGQWQDQPTWLVHFQQRTDRPRRIKGYKVGQEIYPVALKGRASRVELADGQSCRRTACSSLVRGKNTIHRP